MLLSLDIVNHYLHVVTGYSNYENVSIMANKLLNELLLKLIVAYCENNPNITNISSSDIFTGEKCVEYAKYIDQLNSSHTYLSARYALRGWIGSEDTVDCLLYHFNKEHVQLPIATKDLRVLDPLNMKITELITRKSCAKFSYEMSDLHEYGYSKIMDIVYFVYGGYENIERKNP